MDVHREQALRRVGATIERQWRLDTLLGLGGVAAVFSATHLSGARGAVKIMHRELANDAHLVSRFVGEHRIACRVRHPACLNILGPGRTHDDVPVLFMELLVGETVEQRLLRTGPFTVGASLQLTERVLDFLVGCHAAGVVHRDLKPANLFLLREGIPSKDPAGERTGPTWVKVIDFGVARESGRTQTHRRMALGTPAYMSPEQAAGAPDVDSRSDLFAVGAILYRVLTGREIPRERDGRGRCCTEGTDLADQELAAARRPASAVAGAVPALPKEIGQAIAHALAFMREDRCPTARALLEELRAARQLLPPMLLDEVSPTSEDDNQRPTSPSTPTAIHLLEEEKHRGGPST